MGTTAASLTWVLTMLERLTRIVAVALFLEDVPLPRRGAAGSTEGSATGAEEAAAFPADTAVRPDILVYILAVSPK